MSISQPDNAQQVSLLDRRPRLKPKSDLFWYQSLNPSRYLAEQDGL